MIDKNILIDKLKIALMDNNFNENSSVDDTPNWDSLGQLAILAVLSNLSNGESDQIPEIRQAEDMKSLMQILRENDLLE